MSRKSSGKGKAKRAREGEGDDVEDHHHDEEVAVVDLSRRFTFSAAHRMHNERWSADHNRDVFGKCNNAAGHGHNYVVMVHFRGPVDVNSGMVVNLTDVKEVLKRVEESVDHKHLDKDVEWFKGKVSTTETVCIYIWEKVSESHVLAPMLRKVEVWETENNRFVYKGKKTLKKQ